MSFKVGDKVRCVREDSFLNWGKVNVGEIYTVVSCGLAAIRVKEVEGPYWMDCFELATAEIKVGDVLVNKYLGVIKVYDTSTPNIGIRVQLENGTLIYVSPELLKEKPPIDHRDLAISKQHICMPRNLGRNLAMKQTVNGLFNMTLMVGDRPTVTKIIHNGTTTITFFSDGKKVITRPSQDDVEKYDPFIGWCVGVVEHLYGGKEKAKKFYKKHAVVQKEAQ